MQAFWTNYWEKERKAKSNHVWYYFWIALVTKQDSKQIDIRILNIVTGTLQAACQLVKDAGGEVLECVLIVELEELDGKSKVPAPCYCLLKF